MKTLRLLVLHGLALAGVSSVMSQSSTQWEIRAARDDFTDESYIIISPALSDPMAESSSSNAPITDEERKAAIKEKIETNQHSEAQTWRLVSADPAIVDRWVLSARRRQSAIKAGSVMADLSFFLRPFVAIDNGILMIGVTVEGQVSRKSSVRSIDLHSVFPVGDVRCRIDKNTFFDLDPSKNPPLHLPGATEAKATLPSAGSVPPEFAAAMAAESTKQSIYAAIMGDAAGEMLDQMMSGEVIRIARKPDPTYQGMGDSYTAVKMFALGADFRALVERVGLRKNPTTKKWELDPAKAKDRAALMTAK